MKFIYEKTSIQNSNFVLKSNVNKYGTEKKLAQPVIHF